MKRYRVCVNIYVDSENEDEANDVVTRMMCGTETMSKLWDVQDAILSYTLED